MRRLSEDYAKLYREFRRDNPKRFTGFLDGEQLRTIAVLIATHAPSRILDYGSGMGAQYLSLRQHEEWGGLLPHCYDPGVVGLDVVPPGLYDGVISTDVLEHIATPDLPAVTEHIAACLNDNPLRFVYLHISCRPANKAFPDGRNVHLTIKPPSWWQPMLEAWAERHGFYLKVSYEI